LAIVDFIQNEQTVDQGEWFYTSGSDFIFPRGLRVGTAISVKPGLRRKDVQIKPSGFDGTPEQVLIVLEGAHAPIPEASASDAISLQAPPPAEVGTAQAAQAAENGPVSTDADRIMDRTRGKVPSALPPPPAPKP
jgi:hypothetical protein